MVLRCCSCCGVQTYYSQLGNSLTSVWVLRLNILILQKLPGINLTFLFFSEAVATDPPSGSTLTSLRIEYMYDTRLDAIQIVDVQWEHGEFPPCSSWFWLVFFGDGEHVSYLYIYIYNSYISKDDICVDQHGWLEKTWKTHGPTDGPTWPKKHRMCHVEKGHD